MSREEVFELIKRWAALAGLLSAIGGGISALKGNEIVAYFLVFIACLLVELWQFEILRQPSGWIAALNLKTTQPVPKYTDEQRRRAQGIVVAVLVFSVGVISWSFWTLTYQTSLKVFSTRYPFANTGIGVKAGDRLKITVAQDAVWDCGRGKNATPEGYLKEHYSSLVYEQVYPCALIGSISTMSPEIYFAIGFHTTFIVKEAGILYLGCNDSMDRFYDNPTDSSLQAEIAIVRLRNITPIALALGLIGFGVIALIPKLRERLAGGGAVPKGCYAI